MARKAGLPGLQAARCGPEEAVATCRVGVADDSNVDHAAPAPCRAAAAAAAPIAAAARAVCRYAAHEIHQRWVEGRGVQGGLHISWRAAELGGRLFEALIHEASPGGARLAARLVKGVSTQLLQHPRVAVLLNQAPCQLARRGERSCSRQGEGEDVVVQAV